MAILRIGKILSIDLFSNPFSIFIHFILSSTFMQLANNRDRVVMRLHRTYQKIIETNKQMKDSAHFYFKSNYFRLVNCRFDQSPRTIQTTNGEERTRVVRLLGLQGIHHRPRCDTYPPILYSSISKRREPFPPHSRCSVVVVRSYFGCFEQLKFIQLLWLEQVFLPKVATHERTK